MSSSMRSVVVCSLWFALPVLADDAEALHRAAIAKLANAESLRAA